MDAYLQTCSDGRAGRIARGIVLAALQVDPAGSAEARALATFACHGSRARRALDVGTGAGDFVSLMDSLGWDAYGIDTDPKATQAATRRGLRVTKGGLEDHEYAEESFDRISMRHVVEHLDDLRGTLAECNRVLTRSGLLWISTPNAESLGLRRFGPDWRGLEAPRHLQIFTARGLDRLLRSLNFSVLFARSSARAARYMYWNSLAAQRSMIPTSVRRRMLPHVLGLAFQLRERVQLSGGVLRGEELLVLAAKDPADVHLRGSVP